MDIQRKELLNKTETAEWFGVHRQTIRTWQKLGYGPKFSRTPGGREYTTLDSCREFLAQLSDQSMQRQTPRPETIYAPATVWPTNGNRGDSE